MPRNCGHFGAHFLPKQGITAENKGELAMFRGFSIPGCSLEMDMVENVYSTARRIASACTVTANNLYPRGPRPD